MQKRANREERGTALFNLVPSFGRSRLADEVLLFDSTGVRLQVGLFVLLG